MISLTSSIRLATVRLRAHWLHTAVTVLLIGGMFGVVAAAISTSQGLFDSIGQFSKHSIAGRHILGLNRPVVLPLHNPKLAEEATQLFNDYTTKRAALAKKLGLPYNKSIDSSPVMTIGTMRKLKLPPLDQTGIARQVLLRHYSKPDINDATPAKLLQRLHINAKTFTAEFRSIESGASNAIVSVGGKPTSQQDAKQFAIYTNTFIFSPGEINQQFIFSNQGNWRPDSGEIPVMVSYNDATQLLKLPFLPNNASIEAQDARVNELKAKINGFTYQTCYRNRAAVKQVTKYQEQQVAIARGENPKFRYQLDQTGCNNVTITNDKRTKAEKALDAKKEQFAKLADSSEPVSKLLTYRVVGLVPSSEASTRPDQAQHKSSDFASLFHDAFQPFGMRWSVPQNLFSKMPDTQQQELLGLLHPSEITLQFGYLKQRFHYIEFNNAHDAQRFIHRYVCEQKSDGQCLPEGRKLAGSFEFSNAQPIHQLTEYTNRAIIHLIIAVVILAAIILYILIGRSVADSRHEVAVFRAIGFKRIDIALITVVYVLLVAILIILVAGGVGYALAYYANGTYSTNLAQWLTYMFGLSNAPASVSLIHFDKLTVGYLAGIVLGASLLAAIIPTVLSVRRSPLKNLKEE